VQFKQSYPCQGRNESERELVPVVSPLKAQPLYQKAKSLSQKLPNRFLLTAYWQDYHLTHLSYKRGWGGIHVLWWEEPS